VGGLELGARSCVIRLGDGSALVHAPGPGTASLAREIEAIGPVRALIAPNLLHHMYLAECARAFPAARVFAAPGLREKLPELRVDEVLGEKPPEPWRGELDQLVVRGAPTMNEVVFLHRSSRTLLCLDLCFNVRRSKSLFTRLFMRANGAWDRFGPSRLFRYTMLRDARAMRESVDRILAWDFDRVCVAHGDVLESGGREALRESFAWLRG
jgi:glyoxylase-like metal-dependent hydrolase (beta-lactamase superfamily II)